MNKSQKEYKDINRGDYKLHLHKCIMVKEIAEQVEKKYGLVQWKDENIVYDLTNCVDRTNTYAYLR